MTPVSPTPEDMDRATKAMLCLAVAMEAPTIDVARDVLGEAVAAPEQATKILTRRLLEFRAEKRKREAAQPAVFSFLKPKRIR